MKNQPLANLAIWSKAIKGAAEPARAKKFVQALAETPARRALQEISLSDAQILCALFSGSEAASRLLVARHDWVPLLTLEQLRFTRRKQGLRAELQTVMSPRVQQRNFGGALNAVREFRQREMLRIAARDLAFGGRHGNGPAQNAENQTPNRSKASAKAPKEEIDQSAGANALEIVQSISDVADICLDSVWSICRAQLVAKLGEPWHQDINGRWTPTSACVLGMGKLGGQELNYSSDIDVLFVYAEEGGVFREPPVKIAKAKPVLPNHQFFNRLAESVIAEVSRLAPEGTLYRIDLRLRPEGDAGPLSRSVASYENYYAQWGQTWERMMLIKARGVAGDSGLAAEFLEMIQPFRYPRSINRAVLSEVAAMKDRIENEVVRSGELERNVKLGQGGIREIEFVAQSLQLLHAGRQPFLQGAQTLPCLQKLAQYELLGGTEAAQLAEAYTFLRDLEHRLQMENNLQTHSIPDDRPTQTRLARLMGFRSLAGFEKAHRAHRGQVRAIFEQVLGTEKTQAATGAAALPALENSETKWKEILGAHKFRDVTKAWKTLNEFVHGPGFVHVSRRTAELAFQLVPRLLALCPGPEFRPPPHPALAGPLAAAVRAPLSDPDRVLTRLDTFISAYGARATLFELWHSTPTIFELLIKLFDRSEFLAELAIRTPDLVDELVTSDRLRERKTAEQTLTDLRHGINDPDQHLWLRQYHQAELMRIGLRDILGLADLEQYLTELTALADACLQYACEVAHKKHRVKKPAFAVIGLGKLGGREIDYGSDLDVLFVAGAKTQTLTKPIQIARDFTDLLSARTEQGMVFEVDARLRPDGEKGLLVNTVDAYTDYYRQRAMLWEIQSLSRSRAIAGNVEAGEQFETLGRTLANFSTITPGKSKRPVIAAFSTDWKEKIHQMRTRIEKERTPAGKDDLAIKTGRGGLMDAEFLAQAICLEHGWHEPNTLKALERARAERLLPDLEVVTEKYRLLRRLEGILRRWSYEGEVVLPDDPAPYYRVAIRCGFSTSEEFRAAVAEWRAAIRKVYLSYFG